MMQAYDVAIVGGGMIGLSLALSLSGQGMRIAVVDNEVGDRPASAEPESRVSAINLASQQVWQSLGVWEAISRQRLQPFTGMHVWDQDSFGDIHFTQQHVGQPQLGYIIENQVIRQQLWQAAQATDDIELLAPARVTKLMQGQQEAFVHLDNDNMLSARLVVGADGARSNVRKMANLPLTFWDYEHNAIVATIRTSDPHQGIARQVFTPSGPLAFLPLYEPNLCSIVWSQHNDEAEGLMGLDKASFEHALTAAFDARLGVCELASERHSFPLTMRFARQWLDGRVLVVGDAAHTFHPLAGQGANLGIQDVQALSHAIKTGWQQQQDPAVTRHLRQFERARKADAAKMIATMEGFKRLFEGQDPLKKLVRGIGLKLTDLASPVKQKLIRQAMGL